MLMMSTMMMLLMTIVKDNDNDDDDADEDSEGELEGRPLLVPPAALLPSKSPSPSNYTIPTATVPGVPGVTGTVHHVFRILVTLQLYQYTNALQCTPFAIYQSTMVTPLQCTWGRSVHQMLVQFLLISSSDLSLRRK